MRSTPLRRQFVRDLRVVIELAVAGLREGMTQCREENVDTHAMRLMPSSIRAHWHRLQPIVSYWDAILGETADPRSNLFGNRNCL